MAVIKAFKAIRPDAEISDKLAAPPYDVMDKNEARAMAADNLYSFLHISRAEIDLPDDTDPYSLEVYQKARFNMQSFLKRGILLRDSKPMLYIYRQTMGDNVQTGLVCCVSVKEYEEDIIKKHELTRVEKELDRINHFDICNANTEPVFLTYRTKPAIVNYIESYVSGNKSIYDFQTEDRVRHELWGIHDDSLILGLCGLFKEVPALYIADGHHRSASAAKIGMKRRENAVNNSGEEEYNFFMAVIFPDSDLNIMSYNRTVRDLAGNSMEEFIEKIKNAGFEVSKLSERESKQPKREHEFTMFVGNDWYRLTTREEMILDGIIESLDVSILQENILEPILNISDPRTDKRIDFIGGIKGVEELERRVKTDMAVSFALFPLPIEKLLEVADEGLMMPPKSTWFEPKLASGLFVHEF